LLSNWLSRIAAAWPHTRNGRLVLLFGVLNACLYSAVLPLWEGFDEPFHYGYVETLWQTGRLLTLGRTLLPLDVESSLPLTPVSHVTHRWLPRTTTFDEWFALPPAEKERRRAALARLPANPATGARPNYEAHHPPLAYALLALVDGPMHRAPLPVRVLLLRLFGAIVSTVLVCFGAVSLCRTLRIPEKYADAALFTIFCSQMLYATIAHVANDWLAVGVGAALFASLAAFVEKPERRRIWALAIWLTAGLLTKAYFLVFVPFAVVVAALAIAHRRLPLRHAIGPALVALLLAGPWYLRNLAIFGNISGTHEEFDGIGTAQALAAAPHVPWPATAAYLARASLWSGNNSFTSFSRTTLDAVLALLAIAWVCWALRRRAIQPAERAIAAGVALFSAAVAFACCAAFAHTRGVAIAASPWYPQLLLVPVIAIAWLGLSRWGRWGIVTAVATITLWTWVLVATWTVKLFPMYSGAGAEPMRIHDVWNWYLHQAAPHARDLRLLAMAPAEWLYAGMIVCVGLALLLCASNLRSLTRS
jgi:hypothetical protein